MTIEDNLLVVGVKGVFTGKPLFIGTAYEQKRFAKNKDLEDHIWYNAQTYAKTHIANHNLMDDEYAKIENILECIKSFDKVYDKKRTKQEYEKLLDRYAGIYFGLETPYNILRGVYK